MGTALRFLSESAESGAIDRILSLPDADAQLSDPDYWGSVGITSLVGILVVFLILAILIFFFWLMGTIFKAIDKSKAEKKASMDAVKNEAPKPAVLAAAETVEEEDDMEELVAVITAAVAAYEGGYGFEIRSIRKREKNRSAWSMAGINENMSRF